MVNLSPIYDNVQYSDDFNTNSSKVYNPRNVFRSLLPFYHSTDWSDYLGEELSILQRLDVGWDGYDSPPVHQLSAFHAQCLLSGLSYILTNNRNDDNHPIPAPYLVPVSGGALQAEWHFNNSIVEIFFDKDEAASAAFYSESDKVDEFHKDATLQFVGQNIDAGVLLDWFENAQEFDNADTQAA